MTPGNRAAVCRITFNQQVFPIFTSPGWFLFPSAADAAAAAAACFPAAATCFPAACDTGFAAISDGAAAGAGAAAAAAAAPVEAPKALGAVSLADAEPNENGLGVPEPLKKPAAVPSLGAPAALLPNAALAPVNVKEGDVGRESEGGMGRRKGG